jgi:hypothetical protein
MANDRWQMADGGGQADDGCQMADRECQEADAGGWADDECGVSSGGCGAGESSEPRALEYPDFPTEEDHEPQKGAKQSQFGIDASLDIAKG